MFQIDVNGKTATVKLLANADASLQCTRKAQTADSALMSRVIMALAYYGTFDKKIVVTMMGYDEGSEKTTLWERMLRDGESAIKKKVVCEIWECESKGIAHVLLDETGSPVRIFRSHLPPP